MLIKSVQIIHYLQMTAWYLIKNNQLCRTITNSIVHLTHLIKHSEIKQLLYLSMKFIIFIVVN